ncbi:helical backbone metal receptor [Deinococcus aquaedulcis]|uniref:helical backbone metal receptor n=1 Tax=Deinococcus aquaedulcis TaxID=2840455 RepID=UPI001C82FAD6|nr:helical backbone metal receptor [Deinococcus aquaedulcis]
MRLASLTCSNTDILQALDATGLLVAVDSHSDAPGIAHATRLGPDLNIDVPALVAARPDLVLASLSVPGMERVVAEVEAAGLNMAVLDPTTLDQTLESIRQVGALIGRAAQGEALAQALDAELTGLHRATECPVRVVVEWWPRPIIAATRESWVTALLARLGAVNALGDLDGRSRPLTLEQVREARPDLIVCSWCGVKKLRPEVIEARGLGAAVVAIPESGLGRPGPRLIEGARQLRAAMDGLGVGGGT